jgi:ribosomal protein S18 acetylase RimI-like enzyme
VVSVHVRPAKPSDATFLSEMLVVAAFWRPDGPMGSVKEVLERPELAHYIAGWPLPGDLGVVAEDDKPIGAAWIRLLPESDPGYGFVSASTPELSMGVVQTWRRRGVGAYLLEALISSAREENLVAMSLSVEPDNYARRLYERFGFQLVGEKAGSLTLLLYL